VYVLHSPMQARYPALRRMVAEKRKAPKLDPSFICREGQSYAGVFTAYGAAGRLFGREWTAVYRADSPLGPWTYERMYLHLGDMLSLENPSPVAQQPDIADCGELLTGPDR
jgi:hypothetical protein